MIRLLSDLLWTYRFQRFATERIIHTLEQSHTLESFETSKEKAVRVASALQTQTGCYMLLNKMLMPYHFYNSEHRKIERRETYLETTLGWWIVLYRINNWKRDNECAWQCIFLPTRKEEDLDESAQQAVEQIRTAAQIQREAEAFHTPSKAGG